MSVLYSYDMHHLSKLLLFSLNKVIYSEMFLLS